MDNPSYQGETASPSFDSAARFTPKNSKPFYKVILINTLGFIDAQEGK
jgi:hypothetical protein